MNSFSGKSDRRMEAKEEKPAKKDGLDDRTFSEVLQGAPKRIRSKSREAKPALGAKDDVDSTLLSANQTASSPDFAKQKKRDAKAAPAAEAAANEQAALSRSLARRKEARRARKRRRRKPVSRLPLYS